MQIPIEIFVVAIVIIGIGIMLQIIRIRVAFMLIGTIALIFALLPYLGTFSKDAPTWLFWSIVLIIGINILRGILSILFGRAAAEGFTGKLLYGLFTPIFRIIGGFLRTIFRIR